MTPDRDIPLATLLSENSALRALGPSGLSSSAYASLDSFHGLPAEGETEADPGGRLGERWRRLYPGILVALTAAGAAEWLSEHYSTPVMLLALLIGMAFNFLREEALFAPGIGFAAKSVLRIGIALLGIRITLHQLVGLGVFPIALVLLSIASTLLFGLMLSRFMRLDRNFGLLSAGAVGICGASAALAISAILPRRPETERDTILAVIVATSLSTLAMIFYPQIALHLGLGDTEAGIFIGGTIHDVAQVIGAGFSISDRAGDISTYVKLLRVMMLIPVILVISLLIGAPAGEGERRHRAPFPKFLIGFAVMVVLATTLPIPHFVVGGISSVSQLCLVTAMAAVGISTSFRSILAVGWKPIALMVAETAWIAGVNLSALLLLR